MKLQKQLSRKIGNKEYSKYVITLPPKKIKKLGWKEGQELEIKESSNRLVIKKRL